MTPAEHVVMVCLGRESDLPLEEALRIEGLSTRRAESTDDALAGTGATSPSVVAILVGPDATAEAGALLAEAAERLPSTRFAVAAPHGNGEIAAAAAPLVEGGRFIWLANDGDPAVNARRLRGLVQGEGYVWADGVGTVGEASLLAATGRLGGQQHEELKQLLQFASDLSGCDDPTEMLQQALRKCLDLLRCDAGSIYVWDEQTQTLTLTAAEGPDQDQRLGLQQRLGEGLAGWVAEVRQPILVTDTRKVPRLKGRPSDRYRSSSCMAAPVSHGDQMLGVLCLTVPRERLAFEQTDLNLACVLAQKVGSVLKPVSALAELRSLSGRLIDAFKSCTNLVIQKDAEVEALRALSCDILDGIPLGIIAYDLQLNLRFANVAAQSMFRLPADGFMSRYGPPLASGIDLPATEWCDQLTRVVREGEECRLQRVDFREGDASLILDVYCSPLRDTDGVTIGGILTVQDVTEDVAMEAKLSEAQRLSVMGRIAAKVAHELNNPLDGILRFLYLALRRMEEPDKARAYLEESRNGLLRMSNILSQLLAFSRSNRSPDRASGLAQMVHQSLAMYEQRARAMNIEIRLDVPPDLPQSPSNELWDVFGNVIKNSLDAMGEGGELGIRAALNGSTVIFTFTDSGPGVPEDLRDKVFEAFFTTKRKENGTGLGLAACRESMRRIGGDIRLVPSEKGATFEITVPVPEQLG